MRKVLGLLVFTGVHAEDMLGGGCLEARLASFRLAYAMLPLSCFQLPTY